MQKLHPKFNRKKLVIAVSLAMLGGVMSGCDNSNPPAAVPVPPPGVASYTANGGTGDDTGSAEGGSGGRIDLYNDGGTGGVEMRNAGLADASFTTPKEIKVGDANLGANPLAVTSSITLLVVDYNNPVAEGSLTIKENLYVDVNDVIRTATGITAVYANDPALAAGTAYLRSNENISSIWLSDGTVGANDTKVTGLSVAAGVTLTLGNNSWCHTDVNFANDIDNSGTITKVIDSFADGCVIHLGADKYVATGDIVNAGTEDFETGGMVFIDTATGIANSGVINTSGFDENNAVNGDEPGGDGGEIRLTAGGYILNSGALNGSGGDGTGAGGDGAEVFMDAAYTENTADIDASGGSNVSDPVVPGAGGDGARSGFRLISDYGTYNSGNINTSGGNGSQGGDGGEITMEAQTLGAVRNSGNIAMNGGNAIEAGSAGDGGRLEMMTSGGHIVSSGALTSAGGNSTVSGNGGNGGNLDFAGYGGEGGNAPTGSIVVSGDINLNGGNAATTGDGWGGDAGDLSADITMNDLIEEQSVSLLGYVSVDINGGDAAEAAYSDGGDINLFAGHEYNNARDVFAGSAINDVPINARGGNSTTDAAAPDANRGGYGGYVDISASTSDDVRALGEGEDAISITATNKAAIDASGGNAVGDETISSRAGGGGGVFLEAYHGAGNSGALSISGGAGGRNGGNGGEVTVYSVSGEASNSGAIENAGGDGAQYANSGGGVFLFGTTAANSGGINVNGGNATSTDDLVNTYGGWGGEVVISGLGLDAAATNTGNVTYSFGTGDTNGEDGCLQVGLTFEGNCN